MLPNFSLQPSVPLFPFLLQAFVESSMLPLQGMTLMPQLQRMTMTAPLQSMTLML